jgi:hypothetical protein
MNGNLMIFCLALCTLPTYLHAGTEQDLNRPPGRGWAESRTDWMQ